MRQQLPIRSSILALGLTLFAASFSVAQQSAPRVDPDCDGNGLNDATEIAAEPFRDANFNQVLDRCEGLSVDRLTLSVSQGGSQNMSLELGQNMQFRLYWVLGSTAGTRPGVKLGGVHVPLNYDGPHGYFNKTTYRPNQDELVNTLGYLDFDGRATASLTLPPNSDPTLVGTTVHHAFVIVVANGSTVPVWSSNSVSLELVP